MKWFSSFVRVVHLILNTEKWSSSILFKIVSKWLLNFETVLRIFNLFLFHRSGSSLFIDNDINKVIYLIIVAMDQKIDHYKIHLIEILKAWWIFY